jgi:membrane protein
MSRPHRSASIGGSSAGAGRDAVQFWQIPRAGWKEIVVRTWREIGHDDVGLLAAGVAFYSFLAFVPLLAAVVLVYGLIADPSDAARQMGSLTHVLPADAAKIIGDQLTAMTQTKQSRTALGLMVAIVVAIYGSMRGATSVVSALNATYDEEETRSIFRTTGLSLAITLGMICTLLAGLVAISAMTLLGSVIHLPAYMETAITGGAWLVTALLAGALIAAVYRYGPDREDVRWLWLVPGSLFASIGALLGTVAFGFYVSRFAGYNATYGALGAVVSFLMWLYLTAYVLLVGAEFNAEIEHQTARDTTDGPERTLGDRGASMADSVAGGAGGQEPNIPTPGPPSRDARPAVALPGVGGSMIAARIVSLAGPKIGALPLALVTSGVRSLVKRDRPGRGVVLLGLGAVLLLRGSPRRADDPPKRD